MKELLTNIASRYPRDLQAHQIADIPRIRFQLSLIPPGSTVCDIGGGTSMFSAACKSLASRVVVIDDFRDPWNLKFGDEALAAHRSAGVEFICRDVVSEGIGDFVEAFDVITCICSIEHWHASPKRVLHQMMRALVPSGRLIIGLPNALNIRKRISWALGTGEWTTMDSWYEQPVFRSHVREASVRDMRYIARDIGLRSYQIVGRNWAGFLSPRASRRLAAHAMDPQTAPNSMLRPVLDRAKVGEPAGH